MAKISGKWSIKLIVEFLLVISFIIMMALAVSPPKISAIESADSSTAEQIKMNDFVVYYGVGNIAADAPDKIYDFELNKEKQSDITNYKSNSPTTYLYPPHTLLYFAPLTYFSFITASYIWQTIIIICTLFLIVSLYYAGICTKPKSFLIATILITTSLPWMTIMAEGQPMIIMTLGILWCQLLAKHKHTALAGFLLVITTFKPQLTIAPALYLLLIYGKPLWKNVIISAVIVITICTIIFGIDIWQSWLISMSGAGNNPQFNSLVISKMCNLRTVGLLLLGDKYFAEINIFSIFMWGCSIIMTALIGWAAKNKPQKTQELGFALIIAISCFFSPWLHIHTLILLVISVGYLIKHSGLPTLYTVISALIILNPYTIALFFPNLITAYLNLNLILWIPVQIILIVTIFYSLLMDIFCYNQQKHNSIITQ